MKTRPDNTGFDLELLEPRILLSSDGVLAPAAQSGWHLGTAIIEPKEHASVTEQQTGLGSQSYSALAGLPNIFEGVAQTPLESAAA